ncbi:hypothetical protein GCM10029963_60720 [Micromonospora andamanensis]
MGSGLIGASLKTTGTLRPPQPVAGSTEPTAAGPFTGTDLNDAERVPAGLPRAAPTGITIPRIGVRAGIMALGTNPDGTVQVPRSTRHCSPAGTSPDRAPASPATP